MNQLSHCLYSRKYSNSDFFVHLIAGLILYVLVVLMLVARGTVDYSGFMLEQLLVIFGFVVSSLM